MATYEKAPLLFGQMATYDGATPAYIEHIIISKNSQRLRLNAYSDILPESCFSGDKTRYNLI